MSKNYAPIAATTLRLIEKFGRKVTVRRHSRTPANPAAPQDGPNDADATDVLVDCVFVKPPALGEGGVNIALTDDQIKRITDIALIAGTSTTEDLVGFDEIIDGSITYRIDFVIHITPGDTRILYQIGLNT